MRINSIMESTRNDVHRGLREELKYKKRKENCKEELSFSEVLTKVKRNTYLKTNQKAI